MVPVNSEKENPINHFNVKVSGDETEKSSKASEMSHTVKESSFRSVGRLIITCVLQSRGWSSWCVGFVLVFLIKWRRGHKHVYNLPALIKTPACTCKRDTCTGTCPHTSHAPGCPPPTFTPRGTIRGNTATVWQTLALMFFLDSSCTFTCKEALF